MKKLAVLFGLVLTVMLVIASAIPAYAQQAQQTTTQPIAVASDLFNQAGQLLNAQKYDQAVLDLSLFIMLNPTYSPAYYGRAQGYMGLNNYPSALQDVDSALETASNVSTSDYAATLYVLRGQIDQQEKNLDDALKDYTKAISLSPSPQALANRGTLYMEQNDPQSALKDFDSAITMDATNPVYFIYRGIVHTQLKDLSDAGADYLQYFGLIASGNPQSGQIQSGQSINLPMQQGVIYQLSFTATAGQYISALASPGTGNVDPLMVLIDAQGKPLVGDDDSGNNNGALILNYKAATDGQYALVVGHSLGGSTGSIELQLAVSDTPEQ